MGRLRGSRGEVGNGADWMHSERGSVAVRNVVFLRCACWNNAGGIFVGVCVIGDKMYIKSSQNYTLNPTHSTPVSPTHLRPSTHQTPLQPKSTHKSIHLSTNRTPSTRLQPKPPPRIPPRILKRLTIEYTPRRLSVCLPARFKILNSNATSGVRMDASG